MLEINCHIALNQNKDLMTPFLRECEPGVLFFSYIFSKKLNDPKLIGFDWREPFEGYESDKPVTILITVLPEDKETYWNFIEKVKAPMVRVYNFLWERDEDLFMSFINGKTYPTYHITRRYD